MTSHHRERAELRHPRTRNSWRTNYAAISSACLVDQLCQSQAGDDGNNIQRGGTMNRAFWEGYRKDNREPALVVDFLELGVEKRVQLERERERGERDSCVVH